MSMLVISYECWVPYPYVKRQENGKSRHQHLQLSSTHFVFNLRHQHNPLVLATESSALIELELRQHRIHAIFKIQKMGC